MEEEKIDGARSPEKQHIRPLLFLYVSYKKVKMGVSEDVRDREREKDLKEVAHEVMEACKSKICRGRLAGLRPREELTM